MLIFYNTLILKKKNYVCIFCGFILVKHLHFTFYLDDKYWIYLLSNVLVGK